MERQFGEMYRGYGRRVRRLWHEVTGVDISERMLRLGGYFLATLSEFAKPPKDAGAADE